MGYGGGSEFCASTAGGSPFGPPAVVRQDPRSPANDPPGPDATMTDPGLGSITSLAVEPTDSISVRRSGAPSALNGPWNPELIGLLRAQPFLPSRRLVDAFGFFPPAPLLHVPRPRQIFQTIAAHILTPPSVALSPSNASAPPAGTPGAPPRPAARIGNRASRPPPAPAGTRSGGPRW